MDLKERNSWLYDIFVWTGISRDTVRGPIYAKEHMRYIYSYGQDQKDPDVIEEFHAAVKIKNAIIKRPVDYKTYKDLDNALLLLCSIEYGTNPKAGPANERKTQYTPDELAEFIASLCAEKHWWWDNIGAHTTIYERAEMDKTIIGAALTKYKCYTSQKHDNSNKNESLDGVDDIETTRRKRHKAKYVDMKLEDFSLSDL